MGSGGGGRIKLRGLLCFGLLCFAWCLGSAGVGVSVFFRRFRRVYNFHGCGQRNMGRSGKLSVHLWKFCVAIADL